MEVAIANISQNALLLLVLISIVICLVGMLFAAPFYKEKMVGVILAITMGFGLIVFAIDNPVPPTPYKQISEAYHDVINIPDGQEDAINQLVRSGTGTDIYNTYPAISFDCLGDDLLNTRYYIVLDDDNTYQYPDTVIQQLRYAIISGNYSTRHISIYKITESDAHTVLEKISPDGEKSQIE